MSMKVNISEEKWLQNKKHKHTSAQIQLHQKKKKKNWKHKKLPPQKTTHLLCYLEYVSVCVCVCERERERENMHL